MKSKKIILYDAETIDHLPWPETEDGRYAKQFLLPLVKQQPAHYINNIQSKYLAMTFDDLVLPISINESQYENSYVCSPYTHYVSYAKQELVLLENPLLRKGLSYMLSGLGRMFKVSKINKTIHVNNWLVSTNLYPNITPNQMKEIHAFLTDRFPDYTILFRSLNDTLNQKLIEAFRPLNYKMVASRQVYLVHPTQSPSVNAKSRWLLKRDYALIEHHGYEVLDGKQLSEEDIPRILELYNALYLQKYSMYNPQYNENFLSLALKNEILHLKAIRKNGSIDAVLGYFCRNGAMTTPLFGYDLSVPKEIGLYRMLSALLYQIALENGHWLNESSGAAQFKRNRGATGEIEYTAVYDDHLPFHRRFCWSFLQIIIDRIGIPLLQKYKL